MLPIAACVALFVSSPASAGAISAPAVTAAPDSGAATPDVAAVYYNPAAIAAVPGFSAMLDVQAALIRIDATATRNGGLDPNSGQPYDVATARVMVPVGLLGATWQVIPDRLTLGFAANDPFVGGGDYTSTESGDVPPYTGHQRYHGINTQIITASFTPAVGVTVIDGLHVGAGASYYLDHIYVLQASDPMGTEGVPLDQIGLDVPSDPYGLDTYLEGNATGHHWGWNAGLFFDRFARAQVGLSYWSGGTFHASGDGSVDVPALLTQGETRLVVPAKVEVSMPLAPVARLYLASQLNERWRVGLGMDWELWNLRCGGEEGDIDIKLTNEAGGAIGPDDGVSIEIATQQYAPRRLWNAMNGVATVGLQANDKLWLGGRLGVNQYAVPDYALSATNLDFANVGVVLGGRYKVGKVTLGLAYSKFFLLTREITDSAWNLQDGNARFSPVTPYKASANGTYSGAADALGLRIGVDL
ncbi:MAG: outer membrane protein transport protein [Pseudomonadota bacterium]